MKEEHRWNVWYRWWHPFLFHALKVTFVSVPAALFEKFADYTYEYIIEGTALKEMM